MQLELHSAAPPHWSAHPFAQLRTTQLVAPGLQLTSQSPPAHSTVMFPSPLIRQPPPGHENEHVAPAAQVYVHGSSFVHVCEHDFVHEQLPVSLHDSVSFVKFPPLPTVLDEHATTKTRGQRRATSVRIITPLYGTA